MSNSHEFPGQSSASLPLAALTDNTQKLPEESTIYSAIHSATSEFTTAARSSETPPATTVSQPSTVSTNSGNLQGYIEENPNLHRDNSDSEPVRDKFDSQQENDRGDGSVD